MPCASCGAELLAGKQFCHSCGEPVPRGCGSCGAVLDGSFRFCPDCGAPVESESVSSPQPDPAPHEPNRNGGGNGLERFSRAMPAGMAEKLSSSGASIAGERKVVTVLFCDLAGSTAVAERLDPEDYRELLDQYLELAFREIYRFEGIVNQLAGDGLMALFGAPIAHEDDPQRAIWAALAIRDAMADFNRRLEAERGIVLPARIGINTGPVVAGSVGNDLKMDYTAVGDTTNLAARLESLASPGTVLISDDTERLTRGFFRVEAAGPFDVKGKSEAVNAFVVQDSVDVSHPMVVAARRGLTPLVGREEEMAQLRSCFDRISGDFPQLVHIVGDAGSGKSRLIHEFKEQLGESGATFFEARCAALHQLEPYYPFITMLRHFFDLDSGEPADVMDARVAQKIGVDVAMIEQKFPHLCRLLSGRAFDSSEIPKEELQQETTQALGRLVLEESRKRPVVVVFEDLQWADDQSIELLNLSLSQMVRARIMVLISSRPDEAFAWRTSAAVTRLHLRPLPVLAVREIMRSLVGGQLPEEVESKIIERAEGSPFFVEEITRSLLEQGNIQCSSEGCSLDESVDNLEIPGSVREVLAARLDSLDPVAKRIAQLGAVLGRQFKQTEIDHVLGNTPVDDRDGETRRALAQLVDRGVLHPIGGPQSDEYRFGESLTQEVAYESLLMRERRRLHSRVGAMVAERGGSTTLIAHHFALSDDETKAVETLMAAALEAENVPAYRTATDLFRRAWEIAEAAAVGAGREGQQRLLTAALGYCRVVVLYGSSNDMLAKRAAEVALDQATELGDAHSAATANTYLGMVLTTDPENFQRGIEHVERGVRAAQDLGDEVLAIGTSRGLAWNYCLDGRFADGMKIGSWAMERLEAMGEAEKPTDLYLSTMMMQQQIRFYSGDLSGALAQASESIRLCKKVGNRTIGSGAVGMSGYIYLVQGDYPAALEAARDSMALAEEIGVDWGIRRSAILTVAAQVELGDEPPSARMLDLAEEGVGLGGTMVVFTLPLVEAMVALLKFRRAESVARTALKGSAGRLRVMFAKAALGDATLRLGDSYWAESGECFSEALSLAEEIGSVVGQSASLNGLGKLALVQEDYDHAAMHFKRAYELASAAGVGRYAKRAKKLLEEASDARDRLRAVPA